MVHTLFTRKISENKRRNKHVILPILLNFQIFYIKNCWINLIRFFHRYQVCGDGRLIDVIDESWRKERLPIDDISTPVAELPDPESDNGDSHMTLKELEQKWNNLALSSLSDNHLHSPTPLHN
ncbi:anaphase-promoting complex subunit 13 isoform X1 [Nylanderia fulva]|uniref:anaphase-promoting complex subunit 13 isoform X1 n=1 Tax=Nylanderia fulva TaxID=613905 RepID=UPI0010FAF3F0|nr:anaphase-promoting complex subunit 13 isoform X1 [Nylanderia fulva]